MYLLDCYIEHPVRSVDQTFTYYSDTAAVPGARVTVSFNHQNVLGFVERAEETSETPEEVSLRLGVTIKPVVQVLDEEPLITEELAALAHKMKEDTLSTMISCYQVMLPSKIKPKTTAQRVVNENWVRLGTAETSLTPRELEAYCYLRDHGPMKYSRLRKEYPNHSNNLNLFLYH